MAITNTTKPTPSVVNQSKVSNAETWTTIPSQWQNELRSWIDCVSLLTNSDKIGASITNTPKP